MVLSWLLPAPHALGLAIPLVVAITTPIAAHNSIPMRDRLALELVGNIDPPLVHKESLSVCVQPRLPINDECRATNHEEHL
jgi:hypothetical protein